MLVQHPVKETVLVQHPVTETGHGLPTAVPFALVTTGVGTASSDRNWSRLAHCSAIYLSHHRCWYSIQWQKQWSRLAHCSALCLSHHRCWYSIHWQKQWSRLAHGSITVWVFLPNISYSLHVRTAQCMLTETVVAAHTLCSIIVVPIFPSILCFANVWWRTTPHFLLCLKHKKLVTDMFACYIYAVMTMFRIFGPRISHI